MPLIESGMEAWSPGGQATFEQNHAEAMNVLRGAKTFAVLALIPGENGDSSLGYARMSTCETRAHTEALLHLMGQAYLEMQAEYERMVGREDGS